MDDKKVILIVDDDPGIRHALRTRLEQAGYAVDAVTCGEEALHACAEHPPHVIVLDVSMPGMDGYQVCERVRETVATPLAVIFLTGVTHAGTATCLERMVYQSGGDYFLAKPYDPQYLIQLIAKAISDTELAVTPYLQQ